MTERVDGCHTVEPLLSSYAAGALDEASERRVRNHLAECAACLAVQTERDPAALFLELRRAPLPEGFLDGIASGVRRRIEAGERPRIRFRLPFPLFSPRRFAYVAAPVMTILLLGTLFLVRPPGMRPHGARRPDVPASPYVVPPGSARLVHPAPGTLPGAPALAAFPDGAVVDRGAPPLLEEVGSPGARIYTFDVGGNEASIYFVVDESIDIP